MIGLTLSGRKPVPRPNFDQLYAEAIRHRDAGDVTALSKLIAEAHKKGLPSVELTQLGSLVEGALLHIAPPEPTA
jgi:hypothetical protein